MRFAGYYRWLVATRILGLPEVCSLPLLDVGAETGQWLDKIEAPLKIGFDLKKPIDPSRPFVQGDARMLPFRDNTFGGLLAFDVIEHLPDDHAFLLESIRVLKRGGRLWLSTPMEHFQLFPGGGIQKQFEQGWGHLRRGYTKTDLMRILPDRCQINFITWNEPAFRSLYVLLYLLNSVSKGLAKFFIPLIFRYDSRYREGQNGHHFVQIDVDE